MSRGAWLLLLLSACSDDPTITPNVTVAPVDPELRDSVRAAANEAANEAENEAENEANEAENEAENAGEGSEADARAPRWRFGERVDRGVVGRNRAARWQLTWPEARDDVGVAGYRVVADGEVIATLEPTVLEHDAGPVQPGWHVHFVEAFDAAGNSQRLGTLEERMVGGRLLPAGGIPEGIQAEADIRELRVWGSGTVDANDVRETFALHDDLVPTCYQRALDPTNPAGGDFVIAFRVSPGGQATDARATHLSSPALRSIANCFVENVRGVTFRPGPTGGAMWFRYKVELRWF